MLSLIQVGFQGQLHEDIHISKKAHILSALAKQAIRCEADNEIRHGNNGHCLVIWMKTLIIKYSDPSGTESINLFHRISPLCALANEYMLKLMGTRKEGKVPLTSA